MIFPQYWLYKCFSNYPWSRFGNVNLQHKTLYLTKLFVQKTTKRMNIINKHIYTGNKEAIADAVLIHQHQDNYISLILFPQSKSLEIPADQKKNNISQHLGKFINEDFHNFIRQQISKEYSTGWKCNSNPCATNIRKIFEFQNVFHTMDKSC